MLVYIINVYFFEENLRYFQILEELNRGMNMNMNLNVLYWRKLYLSWVKLKVFSNILVLLLGFVMVIFIKSDFFYVIEYFNIIEFRGG